MFQVSMQKKDNSRVDLHISDNDKGRIEYYKINICLKQSNLQFKICHDYISYTKSQALNYITNRRGKHIE